MRGQSHHVTFRCCHPGRHLHGHQVASLATPCRLAAVWSPFLLSWLPKGWSGAAHRPPWRITWEGLTSARDRRPKPRSRRKVGGNVVVQRDLAQRLLGFGRNTCPADPFFPTSKRYCCAPIPQVARRGARLRSLQLPQARARRAALRVLLRLPKPQATRPTHQPPWHTCGAHWQPRVCFPWERSSSWGASKHQIP